MLNKIINRLNNTVDFTAYGAECEKLLFYAANEGIEIINPRKNNYIMEGSIKAKDYKKLRFPARKNGLKLKIQRKNGIYFFIEKNRKKAGFLFGTIFVLSVIIFLNLFIWEINIYGAKNIPEEKILEAAEEMGLKKGSFRKKHNVQMIEWQIMKENNNIANAELNIQGCCANITVRETLEPAEMKPDDDVPINIVASRYGVIRQMNVFDGQDRVKIGDAVMKGDLLVSAVYEDRHNKLTLKHARADIIAETDYTITAEFPLKQKIEVRGNYKKKMIEIEILGGKFFIGNNKNCEGFYSETEKKKMRFLWIELPVFVTTTRYFDVKQKDITYNFEQGKDGAYAVLAKKEEEELFGCEIISRKNTEKIKDDVYIIVAEYVCLMNIAKEQPIESDIPWENTDDMS